MNRHQINALVSYISEMYKPVPPLNKSKKIFNISWLLGDLNEYDT